MCKFKRIQNSKEGYRYTNFLGLPLVLDLPLAFYDRAQVSNLLNHHYCNTF